MSDFLVEESKQVESTSTTGFSLEIILSVIIGGIVIISFIFAFIDFQSSPQIQEAKRVLNLIAKEMENKVNLEKLANLEKGENFMGFAVIIGVAPPELKYYKLGDFIYHKGGSKPAENSEIEFYIEAVATQDKPIGKAKTKYKKVNKNIAVRLYSNGEIKVERLKK